MVNQINNNGFTIEQIYSLVGRYDYTSNIILRRGSDDEVTYGNSIVGVFLFSKSERDELELRIANSNKEIYGTIRFCNLLPDFHEEKIGNLKRQGIDTRNIVSISWLPCTKSENIYPSRQQRSLPTIKISCPIPSKKDTFVWVYEFLGKIRQDGVGLCPEEEYRYLAYKTVFASDNLTVEEKAMIYDEKGKMREEVTYELLTMKFNTFTINRKEVNTIAKIIAGRYHKRLLLLNQELEEIELSYTKLKKDSPTIADYILTKVQSFHQKRFNVIGKYPLYLDVEGYIHILLRHVEEARFKNAFEHKTKFQYEEQDIEIVMNEVISGINSDYQSFKEIRPKDRFVKKEDDLCYYNGDYYVIVVNPNGSIVTFYKRDSSYLKKIFPERIDNQSICYNPIEIC